MGGSLATAYNNCLKADCIHLWGTTTGFLSNADRKLIEL